MFALGRGGTFPRAGAARCINHAVYRSRSGCKKSKSAGIVGAAGHNGPERAEIRPAAKIFSAHLRAAQPVSPPPEVYPTAAAWKNLVDSVFASAKIKLVLAMVVGTLGRPAQQQWCRAVDLFTPLAQLENTGRHELMLMKNILPLTIGDVRADSGSLSVTGSCTALPSRAEMHFLRGGAARSPGEKGDRYILPERPEGCFAQNVPVPFFARALAPPVDSLPPASPIPYQPSACGARGPPGLRAARPPPGNPAPRRRDFILRTCFVFSNKPC